MHRASHSFRNVTPRVSFLLEFSGDVSLNPGLVSRNFMGYLLI